MSRIQDDINKLIKEKEQVDFADSIVEKRNDDFEKFLEQQKENDSLSKSIVGMKHDEFEKFLESQKNNVALAKAQQEFYYENSLYFYQYQRLIAGIDAQINDIYNEIINNCNQNILCFKDALYGGINVTRFISGIGYPIPDKYVDNLINIYKEKLNNINTIDDSKISISLTPSEYLMDRHLRVAKLFNGYILKVEIKRINKKHKVLK